MSKPRRRGRSSSKRQLALVRYVNDLEAKIRKEVPCASSHLKANLRSGRPMHVPSSAKRRARKDRCNRPSPQAYQARIGWVAECSDPRTFSHHTALCSAEVASQDLKTRNKSKEIKINVKELAINVEAGSYNRKSMRRGRIAIIAEAELWKSGGTPFRSTRR